MPIMTRHNGGFMIDYNGFSRYIITLESGVVYRVIAMTELSAKIQLVGMTGENVTGCTVVKETI